MKARTPSMVVFSTLTCSRSLIPGTFFMVAAAPASATGFHSSPVFGSTFQLVRSGAPMIFANCGLTVVGTGTDRAGTSSVCAWAVAKVIAAYSSVAVRSFVQFPAAGFFIALPLFGFLFFNERSRRCAPDAPSATPPIFNYSRTKRRDRTAALRQLFHPDIGVVDHLAPALF